MRLYDLIEEHNANEEHPALDKAAVFQQFFPDRQFKEKAKGPLDSLMTELFRLVRRFLVQLSMEREHGEVYEHLVIARFYRENAFEERFWQTMSLLRKIQLEKEERDTQFFFDQFKIEEEELSFRGLYNSFEDDANLNAVQKNLDVYYSTLKLQFSCALEYQLEYAQIERTDPDPLLQTVLNLSGKDGPLDVPVNRIYRMVFEMIKNHSQEAAVEDFDGLLDQFESQILPDKYKDLRAYQRYFRNKMYRRSGDDFSLHQAFELYEQHLEKGYFYVGNAITVTAFYNLIIFAIKLRKFSWVKKFLDTHPPSRICGTRYPVEVYNLRVADYYFALEKYQEAENTLTYRLFENPTLGLLADLLLVKIYYETQNDLLETRMKALDQKIRRTKLAQNEKERYLNFLRKLDKIVKYGYQPKSPKKDKLISEIKSIEHIVAREWLLEKLK